MADKAAGAAGPTEGAKTTETATVTKTTEKTPPATTTSDAGKAGDPPAGDAGKTTEEPKTDKTGDTGKADEGKAEESKAPERYELKVKDNATAYLDTDDLQRLEARARAMGLSNEDAQHWLDEIAEDVTGRAEAFKAQTIADKEYGGAKYEETQRLARRAIDRIRPDGHPRRESFLRFLERGGAVNHIEVAAFLADLGKAMSEDDPGFTRASDGAASESAEDKLYNHPTSRALAGKS